MKKVFGAVIGALLVAAGVLGILNVFGLATDIKINLDGWWWAVFLILPALYGLITSQSKLGNLFVLVVGVYLLLASRGVLGYGTVWKLIVPLLLVLLGVKFILKVFHPQALSSASKHSDEFVTYFQTQTHKHPQDTRPLAKVGTVFGGSVCDLTDARFSEENSLDVFCLFGGVELYLPSDVEVVQNTFCLFGGLDDKRKMGSDPKQKRLTINGCCTFGGIEIKSERDTKCTE